MKKSLKVKKIFCISFCVLFLVCIVTYFGKSKVSYKKVQLDDLHTYNSSNNINQKLTFSDTNKENQVVYLSDIPYSKAQVAWGNVSLDKTQDNAAFSMLLNGSTTVIKKGIWAHATSTLEYDISNYKDYAYFTVYYGLNSTSGNKGNGVKFYIYTSEDGKTWTLRTEENPTAIKSSNNAVYAKIDIRDANYIKLYANDNGSNANDHAVWGDAKLVTEDYNDNVMTTVEEFDEIIKENYDRGVIKDELKLTLLQRDFIKRVGQYQLRVFLEEDSKNKETLEWFLNNEEALRLWTVGGTPNGTYLRALEVLSEVYHAHKEDLENENLTDNGTKYKDLYLKMMLSLSLSHSTNIGLWIGGANKLSDAVTRYEIYKQMHLDNKLGSNAMFESYTIEEMRAVMFTNIDDEEILWLRDYSEKKFSNLVDRFNPFKYINYTTSYSYYRPQYYTQENYAKWDEKYELSKYNITYQSGAPKLWIVFEEGSVCGGLSKTAANLYGVWGYPAKVLGQPAHAAYAYLYNAGGGNYAWQLSYNVSSTAWAATDGGGRMPNGWGNGWSSGAAKRGSYHFLSQQAQNEYDKYEKAELILLQADIFKDDREKLEQIYRDALAEEIINFDAWVGMISLYNTDTSKSEEDRISLAEEIAEVMTYHPLPMYDLTKLIKITSPEYTSKMLMLQDQTLHKATKATSANTLYHKEVPIVANAILGVVDSSIANFSFNGANAGKITLSKQLQSAQVTWSYSLDGGNTWKECYEHSTQLTDEEIASINVDNDIKIHISGLPMTDANIYTIDITKRTFPSGVISINDEENRIMNATSDMEWTLDPEGEWNSFADTNPIFNGDKKVYVRVTAAGTQVASDPVYFTFKENNSDDTKWYIQSKNLEVVEVNGSKSGSWSNMLDGNINTYWRSAEGRMPAYVTIKLDEPRYISGLDYVPDKSALYLGFIPYGRAQNVNIYVSMDGTNWELAGSKNNLGDNNNLKHIDLPEPKKALYVKFECTAAYSGPINSLTVSVLKLYENVIVNETPRAEVNYNITNPTNKDVTAELINPIRPITVTNNEGKITHTFTENGEFTFEFVDEEGRTGSATARVDWIDKTAPQAEVSFSTTELTNEDVVVTISFDKENITILSKDVNVAENPVDKSKTITFEDNASYELEFADALGNVGTKTIAVDWIDKEAPTAELTYSTVHLTDQPVTVTMVPSEEVTVLNNDGEMEYTFEENGTFTFEFVDRAGNNGTATANVNWISKVPEYTLTYSTTEPTNQDVIVTLELEEGYKIVSNNGINTYTFKENGESSFEYIDENGNRGVIPISVNWIDKVAPVGTIAYSTETETTEPVTATVTFDKENVTITNNDGKNTYTFKENGEFIFEFVDAVGNTGKAIATVTWIGDEPDIPTLPEEPSFELILTPSKDKLNVEEEFEIDIAIDNLKNIQNGLVSIGGQFEYDENIFELLEITGQNSWNIDSNSFNDKNFKFITEKGQYVSQNENIMTIKMKVKDTVEGPLDVKFRVISVIASNAEVDIETADVEINMHINEKIIENSSITSENYEIKENIISKVPQQTTVSIFKENVTSNREFTIVDESGNTLNDDEVIATGMILKLDENTEYTLVITGDINKDGKLSVTDIAKLKLHLIEKEVLQDCSYLAADINEDGRLSVTDLAQLKLLIIGKK